MLWRGLFVIFTGLAVPVRAELVQQAEPVVILEMGGFCDHAPDRYLPAPDSPGGLVEETEGRDKFVVQGDRIASHPGMGVGLRARLPSISVGKWLTIVIVDPTQMITKWDIKLQSGNSFQIGMLPKPGGSLIQGDYRFAVRDGGKILFLPTG